MGEVISNIFSSNNEHTEPMLLIGNYLAHAEQSKIADNGKARLEKVVTLHVVNKRLIKM